MLSRRTESRVDQVDKFPLLRQCQSFQSHLQVPDDTARNFRVGERCQGQNLITQWRGLVQKAPPAE